MSSRIPEQALASLSRRTFFKRTLIGATVIGLPVGLAACGSDSSDSGNTPVKFAVLSDTHFFDTATLGDSAELDAYLVQDRKMIRQSVEIFDAALADIKSQNVDFLMISGDLTKDGERAGHEAMAKRLAALGKKVYVIPGNHDVNNPHARNYTTMPSTSATQVTPDDFRSIYANCGYGSALYSDPNSLSYIAEPADDVWLFAIDSCQYSNNLSLGEPVTAGRISDLTLGWVEAKLQEAKSRGKIVIGMMHHGLIEHFTGQSTLFSEYLVNDRESIAAKLAANGLGVMFTGHFHANDVVGKTYSGNTIYDVETGSTVTAPSPYRYVTLDRKAATLAIATSIVTKTGSHPADFQTWAKSYLVTGLNTLVTGMLTSAPYNLPAAQVSALLPLIVPAMVAHYAGDEKLTDATTQATLTAMASSSDANTKMMGQLILSLWSDPQPADNNLSLTLPSVTAR